jgi:hypothetical protein
VLSSRNEELESELVSCKTAIAEMETEVRRLTRSVGLLPLCDVRACVHVRARARRTGTGRSVQGRCAAVRHKASHRVPACGAGWWAAHGRGI